MGLARSSVSGRILIQDSPPARTRRGPRIHHHKEVPTVKNCKLCKYSKVCNDLPGICILVPYLAVAVVAIALGYLFVTQELL